MKKIFFTMVILITALSLAGCVTVDMSTAQPAAGGQNYTLQAVIDSPANGASLPNAPVVINYHATAQEGLSTIELSVDGKTLSQVSPTDIKQPLVTLQFTWTPTSSGEHVLRVRAHSSKGVWSDDAVVTVNIQGETNPQPQQPVQPQPEQPTKTPQPELPTQTPNVIVVTATPASDEVQIINVAKSTAQLYMTNCSTYKITFSITTTHPEKVFHAYIFTRLWDREGEGLSSWDTGHVMSSGGQGDYDITLTGTSIPNTKGFEFTVLYYQFVAMDKNGNRIAYTDVYRDVRLDKCP